MKMAMFKSVMSLAGVFIAGSCFAQDTNKFSFNVGAGFTEPAGTSNRRLDTGFNLGVGAGYNFMPHVSVNLEFGYNQLGLQSSLLNSIGVPDGESRIYSLTLNPTFHLNPAGP